VTAASRLRAALVRSRARDRSRGYTLVGPHRHDLQVATQGTLAREVLSAGQGKLLVTALKLAAVAVLEHVQGRRPTVIFDDVDAEFDVRALTSVLARLSGRGQVLVSSARGELILPRLAAAEVWHVRDGEVEHRRPEGRGA
jgi:DNA replication and repair protein RecF